MALLVGVGVVLVGCSRNGHKEFCYETVIVSMTVEASAAKAAHLFTPADFLPEVALSEVSVLMPPRPPTNRTMLLLTLENPGRDNVMQAVYRLNQRSDVYWANLSVYQSIGI